jgi:hypothetical protein
MLHKRGVRGSWHEAPLAACLPSTLTEITHALPALLQTSIGKTRGVITAAPADDTAAHAACMPAANGLREGPLAV